MFFWLSCKNFILNIIGSFLKMLSGISRVLPSIIIICIKWFFFWIGSKTISIKRDSFIIMIKLIIVLLWIFKKVIPKYFSNNVLKISFFQIIESYCKSMFYLNQIFIVIIHRFSTIDLSRHLKVSRSPIIVINISISYVSKVNIHKISLA